MTKLLPGIALSIRQPWAWAIINGGKDVENRSWKIIPPRIDIGMLPRKIAIHASKGMTRAEYEEAREFMSSVGVLCPLPYDLVRGGVIGSVTVTRIVRTSQSPWFFGPLGLELVNPVKCEPVPASGQLGIYEWRESGDLDEPKKWMRDWSLSLNESPGVSDHRHHERQRALL